MTVLPSEAVGYVNTMYDYEVRDIPDIEYTYDHTILWVVQEPVEKMYDLSGSYGSVRRADDR